MAIPNIVAVLLLSGVIARETKHYVWDGNLGEEMTDEIPIVESK
jgi:AGCS family alanine or glycine:cation symporter